MIRALMIGAALLCAAPAFSHSWYDGRCCSDYDCEPVKEEAFTKLPDGSVRVILKPGDHKLVRDFEIDEIVPPKDVLKARDGNWHACVSAGQRKILCVYEPPPSS